MTPRLTRLERKTAEAYRAMVRRARARTRRPAPRLATGVPRELSRAHKQAVSRLFCIATAIRHGVERQGVHVAHLRFSNAASGARNPGLQRKPDDRWTLPLCPEEHRLQHTMNESAYWAELGIDPHALARALWDVSPDEEEMIAQLKAAVNEVKAGTSLRTVKLAGVDHSAKRHQ